MATKLKPDAILVRELETVLQDAGGRAMVVSVRGDGWLSIRAKGLKREVMWKLDALYEKGIKEGRVK